MLKRLRIKRFIGIAAILLAVSLFVLHPQASADSLGTELAVQQSFSAFNTSGITVSTVFHYRLTAKEGSPAGNNRDFSLTGNDSTALLLTFSDYGDYSYELRQVVYPRRMYYSYDETVYSVFIRIRADGEPILVISDAAGNKYDSIMFRNSYSRPLPPGPVPKTGDAGLMPYAVLLGIGSLGIAWSIRRLKKAKQR